MTGSILEQIEAAKKNAPELYQMFRDWREALGMEPDGPPPTLAEQKDGTARNTKLIYDELIDKYQFTQSATDPWKHFYSRATHERDMPTFAYFTVMYEIWKPEVLRNVVVRAWVIPEFPGHLGRGAWVMMWRRLGFYCDVEEPDDADLAVDVPCSGHASDSPITLWRGSVPKFKTGLSWTADRDRAEWFGRRFQGVQGRTSHLYRCEVPRERILAHLIQRGEDEYVCDVAGLTIIKEGTPSK